MRNYEELVKRLREAAKMSEALAVLPPHSEGNATAELYNNAADAVELDNYCAECGAKMKGKIEMRKIDICPYCGCEESYVESYEHHVGAVRYRVCCPKCGVYLDSGYWQTADRAIEEWNNRSNSMWWLHTAKQKPFNEFGEGKPVLTVNTLGVMRIAEYVGGVWQTPDGEPITNTKVFPITHWMPLPEPPKEKS